MSMDINKLPSNSNASKGKPVPKAHVKTEEPKVKKVVKGNVKTKKNEIRKFTDIFVAEDINTVKNYIWEDIIVPTTKNLVVDVATNFVETLILGGRRSGSRSRTSYDRPSYRDYSSHSRDDRARVSRSRSIFDYNDIVFDSKRDAEAVLDELDEQIRRHGLVSVAAFYDMCDMTAPYSANNYGWTSINRARVVSVRGGYSIEMPRASEID